MLTIRHKRHFLEPRLPYAVFLDGLYAGTLRDENLQINAPRGVYRLKVQFGGPIALGKSGRQIDLSLSAEQQVEVPQGADLVCEFHDKERFWNLLFDIDLVVWVVSWFVALPPLYKVLSDLFFAVWLVRLVIIRKRYYTITSTPSH